MPDANVSYVASGQIACSRFVSQAPLPFYASEATAGAALLGISQEGSVNAPGLRGVTEFPAAEDGDRLKVYGQSDMAVLVVGDTVSAGQWLKADANAFGVPISLTASAASENYGARALENCLSGGLCRVQVDIGFYIDN